MGSFHLCKTKRNFTAMIPNLQAGETKCCCSCHLITNGLLLELDDVFLNKIFFFFFWQPSENLFHVHISVEEAKTTFWTRESTLCGWAGNLKFTSKDQGSLLPAHEAGRFPERLHADACRGNVDLVSLLQPLESLLIICLADRRGMPSSSKPVY